MTFKTKAEVCACEESLELREEIDRLQDEVKGWTGPECKDKECPDYDGEHPFHSSIAVRASENAQRKMREERSQMEKVIKIARDLVIRTELAFKVFGKAPPELQRDIAAFLKPTTDLVDNQGTADRLLHVEEKLRFPEPLEYVVNGLLTSLPLLPNSGDWHGMLRRWCESIIPEADRHPTKKIPYLDLEDKVFKLEDELKAVNAVLETSKAEFDKVVEERDAALQRRSREKTFREAFIRTGVCSRIGGCLLKIGADYCGCVENSLDTPLNKPTTEFERRVREIVSLETAEMQRSLDSPCSTCDFHSESVDERISALESKHSKLEDWVQKISRKVMVAP